MFIVDTSFLSACTKTTITVAVVDRFYWNFVFFWNLMRHCWRKILLKSEILCLSNKKVHRGLLFSRTQCIYIRVCLYVSTWMKPVSRVQQRSSGYWRWQPVQYCRWSWRLCDLSAPTFHPQAPWYIITVSNMQMLQQDNRCCTLYANCFLLCLTLSTSPVVSNGYTSECSGPYWSNPPPFLGRPT